LAESRTSRLSGNEGWTAPEVVAHLRDAEEYRLTRCQRMRDEEEPFLESFDQEALASEKHYASVEPIQALEAFALLRGRVVELLLGLDESGWQRTARHEELGVITVESHIHHAMSHDLVHIRQIAESL
jgi:DinB superfamily